MKPRLSSSADDPKQSLPNLAAPFTVVREARPSSLTDDPKQSLPKPAQFAMLINARQRRRIDDYIRTIKVQFIEELKETYSEIYAFYNDPSLHMPDCLSWSPPATMFVTDDMDALVKNRKWLIEQELRALAEGHGFVILELTSNQGDCRFKMKLLLDAARVPTTGAGEEIGKKFEALQSLAV